ncbi:lysozyme c-1-like [Uranotaenia lowii]|uniref:lysozyme c-1-like n=1 Tax=Uranotaenia lowii TaxID=190385 RepID=UPI0024788295|nr:lysozyme c-1-like [Uranotaenia lowii]
MNPLYLFAVVLAIVLVTVADAKIFDTCSLAKALADQGIKKADLPNWVCLIQSESSMDTSKKHLNTNGSTDWGLYQINDKFWCQPPGSNAKRDCNVKCTDLLTDDISKATTCAKLIYSRQGFAAWYGWRSKCQGKKLPDLSKCKI